MKYIVELHEDCWLAPWKGDPGRTLIEANATRYNTGHGAKIALGRARSYREFRDAKMVPVES